MEPFIPNDKYDIAGLKNCWHYVYQNIDSIDLAYYGQLARKTYELFLCYNDDVIPKSIIDLTSVLGLFMYMKDYEAYSLPDVIKVVTTRLLNSLVKGYNFTYLGEDKKWVHDESIFGITYHTEIYYLNAMSFDISPILNKPDIKF